MVAKKWAMYLTTHVFGLTIYSPVDYFVTIGITRAKMTDASVTVINAQGERK